MTSCVPPTETSKKHIRFLRGIFLSSTAKVLFADIFCEILSLLKFTIIACQTFHQDIELVCCNGSLRYNKVIIFPTHNKYFKLSTWAETESWKNSNLKDLMHPSIPMLQLLVGLLFPEVENCSGGILLYLSEKKNNCIFNFLLNLKTHIL